MANKSPAPKPSARKKTATTKKPAKAANLQDELKRLEARLKRADTTTRKSVTALETIVQTLDARVTSNKTTGKAQLTRQVNALRKRLEAQITDVRTTIRADLKNALSQGGLAALEPALARASARMDAAELHQADAITKINRHLADMARAVDARLAEEARDRARDIDGVNARLAEAQSAVEARIDTVERDSADALTRVGDQVSQIYDKLQGGRQTDTDTVTAKVNELALQTQAELERYQDRLEARLEELESQIAAQDHTSTDATADLESQRLHEQLSAHILQLQTRIEGLERDAAVQAHNMASAQTTPYVTQPTPAPITGMVQSHPSAPNPYAAALAQHSAEEQPDMARAKDAASHDSHIPAEFDPTAFSGNAQHSTQQSTQDGAAILAFTPPSHAVPEALTPPPMPVVPVAAASASLVSPTETPTDFEPAPLPAAPYADPAYAEADTQSDSPKAVRIGDDGSKKEARKSALVSGRTLKLGVLLVGVSALAIFTARSILGGNPAPNPNFAAGGNSVPTIMEPGDAPNIEGGFAGPELDARPPLQGSGQGMGQGPNPTAANATTLDPIGQYAEGAPVLIAEDSLGEIETEAENGNPIAQFQLGLARIEAGDYASAAALLQEAADSGQPAAQYRLAKLYEMGEGVEQNENTARRLIEQAARGGNRIAMHDLALYYTEGRGGLDFDMVSARSWFEQAALRGVVDSQYNLALLSEGANGTQVPNLKDALFWYSVAANQGDQYAVSRRDTLLQAAPDTVRAEIDARVAEFTPRAIDKAANGLFPAQPWSVSSTQVSSVREDVRMVQTLLGDLGFPVGQADGIMGSRTRTAITEFQRTNGLPQTGRIDAPLIERLQVAAGV